MLDIFDCVILSIDFIGNGVIVGGNGFIVVWSSVGGYLIINVSQLIVIVIEFGIYILEILDIFNDCLVFVFVFVLQDIFFFIVLIEDIDMFICINIMLVLDGMGSSLGQIFDL